MPPCDGAPSPLTEAPPPAALRGLAACRWHHAGGQALHRVLPDGCMDILRRPDGSLWIIGAAAAAALVPAEAPADGLRFHPGALPRLLRLPGADGLTGGALPLVEVAPDLATADSLAGLADRLAARRDDREPGAEARLRQALRALRLTGGGLSVTAAANLAGVSPRQFRRRCLDATGLPPKVLARILRLQRLRALLRQAVPPSLAEAAAAAGFADQPHMAREVRALTGLPATVFAAEARRDRFVQDRLPGAGAG